MFAKPLTSVHQLLSLHDTNPCTHPCTRTHSRPDKIAQTCIPGAKFRHMYRRTCTQLLHPVIARASTSPYRRVTYPRRFSTNSVSAQSWQTVTASVTWYACITDVSVRGVGCMRVCFAPLAWWTNDWENALLRYE